MSKTKYRSKQKYKSSLYSNLMMACVMSECKKDDAMMHPKLVAKPNPQVNEEPMEQREQSGACSNFAESQQRKTEGQPLTQSQTFVMRWNPEISSYKVADFEHAMEDFYEDGFYYEWSIWDHQKVQIGDKFFMLKVGTGNTGIVMSGTIAGLPFKAEDWSGKGRDVRYVRMIPDCMVHPDKTSIITTQSLDSALPGVSWNEGHSGVLLNEEQAIKFDEIWRNFMLRQ